MTNNRYDEYLTGGKCLKQAEDLLMVTFYARYTVYFLSNGKSLISANLYQSLLLKQVFYKYRLILSHP